MSWGGATVYIQQKTTDPGEEMVMVDCETDIVR